MVEVLIVIEVVGVETAGPGEIIVGCCRVGRGRVDGEYGSLIRRGARRVVMWAGAKFHVFLGVGGVAGVSPCGRWGVEVQSVGCSFKGAVAAEGLVDRRR